MSVVITDCVVNGVVGYVSTYALTFANPSLGAAFGIGYTVTNAVFYAILLPHRNKTIIKIVSWFLARPITAAVISVSMHKIAPASEAFLIGSVIFAVFEAIIQVSFRRHPKTNI